MLRKIILAAVLLINSSMVCARWATIGDAAVEIIASDIQITINADGTSETITSKKVKILNERGREANAKISLLYNHDVSKLEILEAKTIVGTAEYPLLAALIEDKPLASAIQGFDQTHQVLLAFPNVKVGAIISVQYKITVFKPDIPGFYESMFEFVNEYDKQANIHIRSALPLFTNVNDPDNYMSIQSSKEADYNVLDIKLLKPVFISIVDEKTQLINPKRYPWVFVASSDNWPTYTQQYAKPYIQVLQQPLPEMYQKIVDQAAKLPDAMQQIALVGALLNDNVQYMGDWQTTNGRHVPQNLAAVAAKRLGDCKDFATGMVAILQKLGMQANVVLVQRGEALYDTSIVKLPGGFHFNHAMVRVELNGKILWVDPTNFFSVANKILPDISDRMVVILDAKNSRIDHIPKSTSQDNVIITKKELDLSNTDIVNVKASLTLHGLAALKMTGAQLQVAQETIDNVIVYQLGNYYNIIDKKVVAPQLDSRIVSDLTFDVSYKEKNMVINTNAGHALLISNQIVDNYIFNADHVSDVYLGAPKIIQESITLTNINVVNTDPLDYTIQSPWVDIIRTVKYKPHTVTVEQKIIRKTSWIDNETIHSPQYQAFVAELARNFKDGIAIVFSNS